MHSEVPSTLNILVAFFLTISVFYCNVKKQNKYRGVRQHPFMNSRFFRSEVQVGLAGFSSQGLTRLRSGCRPCVEALLWRLRDDLTFKLIQAVGRIQFLAVVGLRSLFPGWQSLGPLSQLLKATHSFSWSPPVKASNGTRHRTHTLNLSNFCCQPGKALRFSRRV